MPLTIAELELARHQRELIFKPLEAHVFGAPTSAAAIQYITSGVNAELAELPEDWFDYGLCLKGDGITWGRDQNQSGIEAIGYRDPVRIDVITDNFSMQFTALETNRHTIETSLMQDLSTIEPAAITGEVAFDQRINKPPAQRLLTIARDGSGDDTVYIARQFYAGQVSETGEQVLSDADNGALGWQLNVQGLIDSTAGVAVRHYFGGPGWRKRLVDMGFPALLPIIKDVNFSGGPFTAGTWTYTVDGATTSGLAYNVTAAAFQTALEGLSTVGAGNVTVTGSVAAGFTITFTTQVSSQSANGAGLTPVGTVVVTNP